MSSGFSGSPARYCRLSPSFGRNAVRYTTRAMRSGTSSAAWVTTIPPMLWPTRTTCSPSSPMTSATRWA